MNGLSALDISDVRVLQYVVVRCSLLQCVLQCACSVRAPLNGLGALDIATIREFQCIGVYCSVCCSVLQCMSTFEWS